MKRVRPKCPNGCAPSFMGGMRLNGGPWRWLCYRCNWWKEDK